MPDTTLGITYPASTAHTRIWEHAQELATDVDTLIAADRAARDAAYTLAPATITGTTSGTWTSTSATNSCYYKRNGRQIHYYGTITFGASTSVAALVGSLSISLPVAARATSPAGAGGGHIQDASAASRTNTWCRLGTTTSFFMMTDEGAFITSTVPWSWGQSDIIEFNLMYEAATA